LADVNERSIPTPEFFWICHEIGAFGNIGDGGLRFGSSDARAQLTPPSHTGRWKPVTTIPIRPAPAEAGGDG
jgi:hypothetical protein